jgi:hypothetical protein
VVSRALDRLRAGSRFSHDHHPLLLQEPMNGGEELDVVVNDKNTHC